MKLRHLLTGFFAGELSPFLNGRVDTDQYRYGLDTCENFLPTIEGPLVKRPGFFMIEPAAATASWMGVFRFSVTQEYALEFSETALRFYTNGGQIQVAGSPYEVTTPYTAAEAPFLSLQQNFDRLYIDHPSHAPGALVRTAAATFSHETTTLKNGPFGDTNGDDSKTITVTGALTVGGAVDLAASSAIFDAGMIGSPIRLEALDFSDVKAWEPQMAGVVVGNKVRNAGKVYKALTAGDTGTVPPTHTKGSAWDGQNLNDVLNAKGPYGVEWEYEYDEFGIATITAVASATSATATVTRRFPDSLAAKATYLWALGAFSDYAGWPGLVALFEGRLVHFKDFDFIGSVVGDYGGGQCNFAAYTNDGLLADDLAFRRRISTTQPPLWMKASGNKILIGTADREIAIGAANVAGAFSGTNLRAADQSFYGSEQVAPEQVGTQTIFIERGGRRIRAADYEFANDRYDAPDLTAAAGHITLGGVVQLASQRVPYALIYGVRGDGQLVVHPSSRQDVKGLARIVLGGGARAVSAVSIKGADGKTDELWLLVERENGVGATVREIWQQAKWRELGDDQVEQFFVDGGVRVAATEGQTHFSGLMHLASQPVAVLCNGGVVPDLTVAADGTLDLPEKAIPPKGAFIVMIGLAYTAKAVTMRPPMEANGSSSQGVRQKVLKLLTRVLETVGIKIGTPGFEDDLAEIIDRSADDPMDAPIPLKTGDFGGEVEAEFNRDGRATFVSEDPVGAVVTMAALDVEVDFANP